MTAEEIIDLRQRRYNATAVYLHLINPDLMILRVKPDFPRPAHHTGQYCTLGLGYWERRTEACQVETLTGSGPDESGAPGVLDQLLDLRCPRQLMKLEDNDWLEFYIVLVRENPDGRVPALTPRLFALQEGDRLQIGEKITGHYTLDPVKPGDTVVFLGTGTGEAPHNYMTLGAADARPHGENSERVLRALSPRPRLPRHAPAAR